jgi:hypothetical protein
MLRTPAEHQLIFGFYDLTGYTRILKRLSRWR